MSFKQIISVNYNFVDYDGNILLTFSVDGDIVKNSKEVY